MFSFASLKVYFILIQEREAGRGTEEGKWREEGRGKEGGGRRRARWGGRERDRDRERNINVREKH